MTPRPTNECLIEKYLNAYQHSPESVKTRKSALHYFFNEDHFGYEGHIFDITDDIIEDYFLYLKNLDSVSKDTRKLKWSVFLKLLRVTKVRFKKQFEIQYDLDIVEVLDWNGAIPKAAKIKTNKKVIATIDEIQKILHYYKEKGLLDYVIYRFFVETGIRKGELIKSKLHELNIKERYLNIHDGKTGEKFYIFSEELGKLLKVYLNERNRINGEKIWLFLNSHARQFNRRVFNKDLEQARESLGFKPQRRITCHSFRRTLNDMRKKMGCPLEDRKLLLGHKIREVNVKSYTDTDFERLRELFDKWNPYKDIKL